ncbi:ABC transporter ATP-binding protein [Rothia halotolerans]|uniref:ABC transporter ATP-binding protein n=1 Tax=Rothia halotolerans TaxID=405770 RepID=UPI00101C5F1D|nr:ABC transporter ATP-binding protein [Rothia halotolerans]
MSAPAAPGTAPETTLPIARPGQVWREILRLAAPHAPRILASVVLLAAAAACGLVLPWLLGAFVDLLSGDGAPSWIEGTGGFWRAVAAMVGALVAGAGLQAAGIVLSAGAADRVVASLRERAVGSALGRSQAEVEAAGTGDVVSRSSDDVAAVTTAVNQSMPALTGAGAGIVVTLIGMASIHWAFALSLVVTIPVYWFSVRRYLRVAPGMYHRERAERARRAGVVLGAARGGRTVRAYGMAGFLRGPLAATSWVVARMNVLVQIATTRLFGGVNLAEFLGVAALLGTAFLLLDGEAVTLGAATSAVLFFLRIFDPVGAVLMTLDQVQSALTSLSRIVGMAGPRRGAGDGPEDPEPREKAADGAIPRGGDLMIEGLLAGYGAEPVVRGVDLAVPAGTSVAVVGASGAGKSTLAAVVAGVREPQGGKVTIDGRPVHGIPAGRRARTVALVAQEGHVFPVSLRENLDLASPGAEDGTLWEALRRVGLEDWARALPGGLDTVLGPEGVDPEPELAQQLALARVAVLDPAVLVLDEAASRSAEDDDALARAAEGLRRGRTAMIVAHRLSQARTADRILVMEDGRVVESGGHEELVAAGGRYADLWAATHEGRRED